jgi:cysteine desulfurase
LLYFDHNATTFVAPEVAEVMTAALRDVYGNPSSIHRDGQHARQQLEQARQTIATFLGIQARELVFTSGGTESNNLAILGLVRSLPGRAKHVVTTTIEHPAVLEPCRQLEREGVRVSYVPADRTGVINIDTLRQQICPDTVLVSVMHANNETGVIQPVEEVAAIVRSFRDNGQNLFYHSDGVQAAGKIEVDLGRLGVDLYSISAHKIFAPKGVGGLFVRNGLPLRGLQLGGRHEGDRRAGTENVPAAMAFARAVELCKAEDHDVLANLRDSFESDLIAMLPDIEVNGTGMPRLPNTSNILFRGVSAQNLTIALDMKGIAVSTGAACSSGSLEPSPVLLAMGLSREEARSSVRFSFGRYQTREHVRALRTAISECMTRLRTPLRTEHSFVS